MYYFSGTSKKYIDAQQFCARVNAYLVEFYNLVQYREVGLQVRSDSGQTKIRSAMRWFLSVGWDLGSKVFLFQYDSQGLTDRDKKISA